MCCTDVYSVVAGVLIGWFNDTWALRLVVPFAWGLVYLAYLSIVGQEKRDRFITNALSRGEKPTRWFTSHAQAYWFIEYNTAVLTSMFLSVITGLVKMVVR